MLHHKSYLKSKLYATPSQYACSCTPRTARPLGSFSCRNDSSHARASAVEQATLGTLGTLFAALTLGAYFIGEAITGGSAAGGSTLAFLTLALSQTFHAYNMRSGHSLFKIGPFSNHKLNWVTLISLVLIAFVLYTPGVVTVFGMMYIPWYGYLIGVGFSLVPILLLEISKAIGLIRHHH